MYGRNYPNTKATGAANYGASYLCGSCNILLIVRNNGVRSLYKSTKCVPAYFCYLTSVCLRFTSRLFLLLTKLYFFSYLIPSFF